MNSSTSPLASEVPLATARNRAAAFVAQAGYPKRGQEYWKFTDPSRLNSIREPVEGFNGPGGGMRQDASSRGERNRHKTSDQPTPQQGAPLSPLSLFSAIDRSIIDVSGKLTAIDPSRCQIENGSVCILRQADLPEHSWVSQTYGVLELEAQSPVPRTLASANTWLAETGICIWANGQNSRPIELRYRTSPGETDVLIHHVFRIDAGASLTVMETGTPASRINKVIEVEIDDGGEFNHVQVQGREHDRVSSGHIFARLGSESVFRSFTLTANGSMTRNECVVTLAGDRASAHVAGAAVGDRDFHHDDTVFVTHAGQDCESRQVFKKVLRNGAVGVFQGKILVKPGAQKTDGYQLSQGLLLDELCQFLAKPELEIYADDVVCSHGSTCGTVDTDALFYLRSRGITETHAQDILALAFLMQALDEIADPRISDALRELLANWLARHHQ